jgi:Tfp pilus assembly protein PilF
MSFSVRQVVLGVFFFTCGIVVGGFGANELLKWGGGAESEAKTAGAWQSLSKREFTKAESLIFEAIESDPSSYVPYVQLGELHLRRGEVESARSSFERALIKLNGSGGHFKVKQLDTALRTTERQLLRDKIEMLDKK